MWAKLVGKTNFGLYCSKTIFLFQDSEKGPQHLFNSCFHNLKDKKNKIKVEIELEVCKSKYRFMESKMSSNRLATWHGLKT